MLNADFYPTPAPIIRKMLDPYGDLDNRHILEPSAGKGDILDAIAFRIGGYRHDSKPVYAIESDPELSGLVLRQNRQPELAL